MARNDKMGAAGTASADESTGQAVSTPSKPLPLKQGKVELVSIKRIKVKEPFSELFRKDPALIERISQNMRVHGFRMDRPLIIYDDVLVEGHQRFEGAKMAGLEDVPTVNIEFPSEEDALRFAVSEQANRRNLDDAGVVFFLRRNDMRFQPGRPPNGQEPTGSSAKFMADLLHVSPTRIERCRQVIKTAPARTIDSVEAGKLSCFKVLTKSRRTSSKPQKSGGQNPAPPNIKVAKVTLGEIYVKAKGKLKRRQLPAGNEVKAKHRHMMKELFSDLEHTLSRYTRRGSDGGIGVHFVVLAMKRIEQFVKDCPL